MSFSPQPIRLSKHNRVVLGLRQELKSLKRVIGENNVSFIQSLNNCLDEVKAMYPKLVIIKIIFFIFRPAKYPLQPKITKKTSNPCVKTEKESKRNRRGCDPSE